MSRTKIACLFDYLQIAFIVTVGGSFAVMMIALAVGLSREALGL